jgi:hypothetical protein
MERCMKNLLAASLGALFASIGGLTAAEAQTVTCAQLPALTGDVTTPGASCATTIASGAVTSGKIASGAAIGNIGYTPASRAGDTISGSFAFSTQNAILQTVATLGGEAHPWNVTRKAGVNTYQYITSGTMGVWDTELGGPVWAYDFASHVFLANKFQGDGSLLTGIQSQNVGFQRSDPGAAITDLSAKSRQIVNALDFVGVTPSTTLACSADSTTGLQNAINAAGSGELHITAPKAQAVTLTDSLGQAHLRVIYCFSGLSVLNDGLTITIDPGVLLLMTSTTANGFVLGDNVHILDSVILQGGGSIATASGVNKTAGSAIIGYYTRNLVLRDLHIGSDLTATLLGNSPAWNGVTLAGFAGVTLEGMEISRVANDGLIVYAQPNTPQGSPGTDFAVEVHLTDRTAINYSGHFGVHIAGGVGGFYCHSANIGASHQPNVYVDRTLDPLANANPQIFLNPGCTIDSAGRLNPPGSFIDGVHLEDSSYGTLIIKGWIASSTGHGIYTTATQNPDASVTVDGAHIYANGLHGIAALGGNWEIGGATHLYQNGAAGSGQGSGALFYGLGVGTVHVDNTRVYKNSAYGVDDQASAGHVSLGDNAYVSNTLGAYRSVNGLAPTNFISAIGLNGDPHQSWNLNSARGASAMAIAGSGGTLIFAPGSGEITVTDWTNGNVCKYIAGGGNVVLLGQTQTSCVANTSSPGPGQTSIYFNGTTNYVFKSNKTASQTFGFSTWSARDVP